MKRILSRTPFVILLSMITSAAAEPVDLLIVAPHPDDEVIGCTGVIVQALAENRTVAVVVMTNGDGFPKGAAAITEKPKEELKAEDFFELGKMRQSQSMEAIELIGLTRSDITFLSYPDGGLAKIYHAENDAAFRSPHTKKSETYRLAAKDYHSSKHNKPAPFTKAAIVQDLAEIIRERAPSEIYVTNELDQHSDHRAAMWFVRDASAAAEFEGTLYTFVVHGSRLPNSKTRRISLSEKEIALKRKAIGIHKIPTVHDDLADKHSKPEEWFWPLSVDADY